MSISYYVSEKKNFHLFSFHILATWTANIFLLDIFSLILVMELRIYKFSKLYLEKY
jgi:hypothetical protein